MSVRQPSLAPLPWHWDTWWLAVGLAGPERWPRCVHKVLALQTTLCCPDLPPLPLGTGLRLGPSNSKGGSSAQLIPKTWYILNSCAFLRVPARSLTLLVYGQSISSGNSGKTGGYVCKTNLWKTSFCCGICTRGMGGRSSTPSLEPPF